MGNDALDAQTTCYGGLIEFNIFALTSTKEYNQEKGMELQL